MRIRTQEDVDVLEHRIKERLGIDVSKYRNEEAVERFVELLVFPEYVVKWVVGPVLFSIILYIIGFRWLDLVHIDYLIYAVLGFGLFLSSGILLGFILLLVRMKNDMWGIMDYTLDIMKEAVQDLRQASLNVNEENRKDSLGLLFKGIIHIVTIPLLSKVISQKIPFVGRPVNLIVKKILILVSDRIKFDEQMFAQEMKKKEESLDSGGSFEVRSDLIATESSTLEKILNVTFGIAKFPLLLSFVFSFLALLLLIYLVN